MARRLPPLKSLRVFEVAARHLSFTRAAEELHVTQAAVSHQIKTLEDWLGIPLFRRLNRALLLTDEGQTLYPPLREALDQMAAAIGRLHAEDASGALTVSTIPSFAAKWLVPRLSRFRQRHPAIDLRLSTTFEKTDFSRDDVDVAVRYGQGPWPKLHAVRLMTEEFFLVCSPALLEGPHPLRTPADLKFHTLLHDIVPSNVHVYFPNWESWLEAAGASEVDPSHGPSFLDASMTIQTAIDGQGVALARTALAVDDLAAGRLVKLFDVVLPAGNAYWIISPEATADRPKIKAFRDWLLSEVEEEGA